MSKLKVLDLFSGIGGFSLGLEKTGKFETVAFCEIEKYPRMVLSKHWPDVPVYDDVTELDNERLESDGITGIDVITGGFPCQDISIAGKGAGLSGERSGLWYEYQRLISDIRPRYAIVENVSALLNRGLADILGGLASLGYDATWTMLDSQYAGTPQRRRRVYILGVRDGIPEGTDVFMLGERSGVRRQQEMEDYKERRKRDIEKIERVGHPFAFFTRQRSDEYAVTGLSSTLTKRDYKSYTDIVLQDGALRRVTPRERMLLQGFPADWMEGLEIPVAEQFKCNGMTVNVIEQVGECIADAF